MQCAFFCLVIFPYSENQAKTRLFFPYWENLLLLKACFMACEKILQIVSLIKILLLQKL